MFYDGEYAAAGSSRAGQVAESTVFRFLVVGLEGSVLVLDEGVDSVHNLVHFLFVFIEAARNCRI